MKTVAFIFARGGSKGLPGKNIKNLNNLPLIAHSIKFALKQKSIDDIIVSTDCSDIARVAKFYGAKIPFMRPSKLSTDESPEMESWKHAVDFYREEIGLFDCFLSLPSVSPLRKSSDLLKIWPLLDSADFVLSVKESDANPYFNLLEKSNDGFKLSKSLDDKAFRRQDARKAYQIIPMYYACKPESIDKYRSLMDGKIEAFEIPKQRAADVDTIEDFNYLEYLMRNMN